MEAFYTLQGEGAHAGRAAYFIRLAGCDVGCHWCDVKESWSESGHPLKKVDDIVNEAKQYPTQNIVITGGEPCMHNLTSLCTALKNSGFKLWLETSGSSPLSGSFDWICLSPKKFKKPLPEFYSKAHELKVIVFNKSDLLWAEEEAAKVNASCTCFLQAEWGRRKEMDSLIVEYILLNPQWRISLQTHKYLDIP